MHNIAYRQIILSGGDHFPGSFFSKGTAEFDAVHSFCYQPAGYLTSLLDAGHTDHLCHTLVDTAPILAMIKISHDQKSKFHLYHFFPYLLANLLPMFIYYLHLFSKH